MVAAAATVVVAMLGCATAANASATGLSAGAGAGAGDDTANVDEDADRSSDGVLLRRGGLTGAAISSVGSSSWVSVSAGTARVDTLADGAGRAAVPFVSLLPPRCCLFCFSFRVFFGFAFEEARHCCA